MCWTYSWLPIGRDEVAQLAQTWYQIHQESGSVVTTFTTTIHKQEGMVGNPVSQTLLNMFELNPKLIENELEQELAVVISKGRPASHHLWPVMVTHSTLNSEIVNQVPEGLITSCGGPISSGIVLLILQAALDLSCYEPIMQKVHQQNNKSPFRPFLSFQKGWKLWKLGRVSPSERQSLDLQKGCWKGEELLKLC
ncbi:hypothetical protein EI94DRAFT_1703904 [Lactarius quietus]|nr:hypothetical protein EI94DRAFT_1703904 [Lactarius quietus]